MDKWDERFLRLAQEIASWSKDPRTQVGCVIVRPDRTIASTGFNGLPRKVFDSPEILKDRESKHKLIIHAEENALMAVRESVAGYTAYCSVQPCSRCAAKLIHMGITRVVCPPKPKADPKSKMEYDFAEKLLRDSGLLPVPDRIKGVYYADGPRCGMTDKYDFKPRVGEIIVVAGISEIFTYVVTSTVWFNEWQEARLDK